MSNASDTPTTPDPATPAAGNGREDGGGRAAVTTAATPHARPAPRLPSLRATAMLAAAMLSIGVAVGAAIGPAPSTSLAGEQIPLLLPSLVARAVAGSATQASTPAVQPPPATHQATPAAPATSAAGGSASATAQAGKSKTPVRTVTSPISTPAPNPSASKTPAATHGKEKQAALPPVTSVWLITLSGASFTQALAQATAAPYINSQLVPAGTLISGWSSLDASAFADEAGLLAGEEPQTVDSIVQPPSPEGAPGAQCAPETAGALTAADEFLKATVPAIVASAAYRAHGLIVITFGSIGNATASSLPAGASTATLSSAVAVGVLVLSPFAHAGARPTSTFNPTSPKQSLSRLLH